MGMAGMLHLTYLASVILRTHMYECEIFLFLTLDSATSPVPRSVTSQASLSKDQCTVPGNIPYPQAIPEFYTEPY